MDGWSVYIVRCADGSLYTGIAKDVARRVDEHNLNNSLGANYTRARRPVTLVYQEAVATRSAAGKREYEIKCMSRAEKQALVEGAGCAKRVKKEGDAKGGESMTQDNGGRQQDAKGSHVEKTHYVLIDYENVQVKSLALLNGEHFRVHVFLGPKNTKLNRDLVIAMHAFGDRGKYVELEAGGSNALDFHIAYYLGVLAQVDPTGYFHIISKDTGFDPLLQHLKGKGVSCVRAVSIEAMPCRSTAPLGTVDSKRAAEGTKPKPSAVLGSVEDMIAVVLENLMKRKTGRPATAKTLRSTIHARCGKERPADDIDAVYEALVKRGYVTVEGSKVTYSLPAAAQDSRA